MAYSGVSPHVGSSTRTFLLIFLTSFTVRALLMVVWAGTHADFYSHGRRYRQGGVVAAAHGAVRGSLILIEPVAASVAIQAERPEAMPRSTRLQVVPRRARAKGSHQHKQSRACRLTGRFRGPWNLRSLLIIINGHGLNFPSGANPLPAICTAGRLAVYDRLTRAQATYLPDTVLSTGSNGRRFGPLFSAIQPCRIYRRRFGTWEPSAPMVTEKPQVA